jgi:glycine dehydrogenase subunit 1
MPYIPHTEQDAKEMLATIGVNEIEDLFDEIPAKLKLKQLTGVPESLSEMEISRLMQERAAKDGAGLCFIGAGAYEHYVPAAIWEIISRGEFMTAYTPYQAEASQGTLTATYEYQTMMANLMAMDLSNASMYDGASAVAEAVLMAVRANQKSESKTILVPQTLHPSYRQAIRTMTVPHNIKLFEVPFDNKTGAIAELEKFAGQDITALVISQPNFFGVLEDIDIVTDWAHDHNILVIAAVNPLAMSWLKPPGEWGKKGADIAVGDGQPLGVPLSSGGPYFGFMCCKTEYMRNIPGRVIGKTTDEDGKVGYVITLQAREQHIRRAKATSNICSNQALMATAATIYMSLLGTEGLRNTAINCRANAEVLRDLLTNIAGVEQVFSGTTFHEFVLRLTKPADKVLNDLAKHGVQGGYDLAKYYPKLGNCLLVCATETKTEGDLKAYVKAMEDVL